MGVVWEWRSHWVTAISLVAGCWGSGCQWWPQVIWKIWPLNWPKLPSPSENTWYSSGWKKATGATGSSQKFLFATLKTCICVYSSKKILKPNRIEPTQFHNERLLNWVDPPKKELNRIGFFSLWITSCVFDRWGHYFTTSWVLGYCHGGHRAFRTEPCGSTVASLGTQQNCGWNDDNSNRSRTINYPKWRFSKGNPLISGKPRLVTYYNLVGVAPPSISRPPGSLDGCRMSLNLHLLLYWEGGHTQVIYLHESQSIHQTYLFKL